MKMANIGPSLSTYFPFSMFPFVIQNFVALPLKQDCLPHQLSEHSCSNTIAKLLIGLMLPLLIKMWLNMQRQFA